MHTLLNRGESVHQLQCAIYNGKIAPERGRRCDEMIAISGSLTLLTNLVIAWNTQRMQSTLDNRLKAPDFAVQGRPDEESEPTQSLDLK